MTGQIKGCLLPDVLQAEGVDEPRQGDGFGLLNRSKNILCAFFGKALKRRDVAGLQIEQIRGIGDEPLVHKLPDDLRAKPLDVESGP